MKYLKLEGPEGGTSFYASEERSHATFIPSHPVTAMWHSRLTEGDENVSRYGIKEAFVGYDAVLIPFTMEPSSSREKFLKENTGKRRS